MLAVMMLSCWLQPYIHFCTQMMQRRTAAAEHALKKAELRVRSAELRAQSAESELAQLRKVHAVSAHAMFLCVWKDSQLHFVSSAQLRTRWNSRCVGTYRQGLTFCCVALHTRQQSSSVQSSEIKFKMRFTLCHVLAAAGKAPGLSLEGSWPQAQQP